MNRNMKIPPEKLEHLRVHDFQSEKLAGIILPCHKVKYMRSPPVCGGMNLVTSGMVTESIRGRTRLSKTSGFATSISSPDSR